MDTITEPNLIASFLRHQKELQQFLTYKVDCAETAADLIQETYLRIARHTADTDIANPRAFLFRVADNLALDHLRGKARQNKRDGGQVSDEIACHQPQPDSALVGQQQMELFEKLIYQLPPQCRTVFLLCRVEGKSYSEIAAELGISPRTVESHMYKALKFLKDRVDFF
ncbi:MAG: RNA polymerase sigma factor [Methylomonas sp.]|jgi:RNA polymerase sigma-70 factor (ECF subfamily)|uniref:RNA polymerase sigma factor n=1 Tax=Methylomonas sp. TaxID=418 RepID=UPI0025E52F2C|nr:RNA polymerase sigma factor [Methylomonas sp.]MCK9609231.1 RNA polymerase sigma factor [Methylomonas sp.]